MNGIFRAAVSFFIFSSACFASLAPAAGRPEIAEHSLLKFRLSSEAPMVGGEAITLFVQSDLTLPKHEVVLEAVFDGAPFSLTRSAPSLWLGALPIFSEVKTHLIEFRISMRRTLEARRIEEAVAKNDVAILDLDQKIADETDPIKLAALEALRAEKIAYRSRLRAELESLAIFLKTETFSFSVAPNPLDENFPFITRLNPGVGLQSGGSEVKIRGRNFLASPEVRIGGVSASVVASTNEIITVMAPPMANLGAHDVVVSYPNASPPKNAVLRAGYFATNPILLKNVKPVAVVSPYQKVLWPNPPQVQLDGSGSYDENGDSWGAEWRVVASPTGSGLVPGSILSTAKKPKFAPDAKGFFVFQIVTKETATAEMLESMPASTTVEVNP